MTARLVPSIAGNEGFWNYLRWKAYISTQHRIMYVATPKAACTSLAWWFAGIEGAGTALRQVRDSGETDPELVIHDSFWKIAPHVTGLAPEALAEALVSDQWFRFAVVRNPYRRIFSAWQSKLLLREPLQAGPYVECEFFRTQVNNRADIARAFEGFMEHLAASEAPSYRDLHWTPQVDLLRPDLLSYDRIERLENTQGLSSALAERLGPGIAGPFAGGPANESLIPYLPGLVTERAAGLVRSLYAADFELFGYDRALPEASCAFSDAELGVALKAVELLRGRHRRLAEIRSVLFERIQVLDEALAQRPPSPGTIESDVGPCVGGVGLAGATVAQRRMVVVTHDAFLHGAQHLALNIARALCRDRGFEVEIVCLGEGPLKAEFARCGVLHDLAGIDPAGPVAVALACDLHRRGFRHALVNTAVAGRFLATLARAGLQCVALIHEMSGLVRAYRLEADLADIARYAMRVVFAAPEVRSSCAEVVRWDPARTLIRPQGLYNPTRRAAPGLRQARARLRARFGIAREVGIMLAVGFADHRKGVDLFIDIAAKLAAANPLMHSVWIGHWDPDAQRAVAELRHRQPELFTNVHFSDRFESLAAHYAGADIFALTSREDPFPSTVLEAMDAGLPVVAFDGSGGANTLIAEGAGVNVDALDTAAFAAAVFEILASRAKRDQMARRGREIIAERFSFGDYIADLIALTHSADRSARAPRLSGEPLPIADESVHVEGEFVARLEAKPLAQPRARLICFYLPQYHAIPENDAFWGEGFTEWANVRGASASFAGHYQPRVPGELGYYNLLERDTQVRQVELAHLYGIGGFCFYFYWFGGKRLLEAPVRNYLEDAALDLPFCLCWANENWTRRWDGLDGEVLIEQVHSADDDLAFIAHVASYLRDPRYIRVGGRPLLLVYRPSLLPAGRETAERWRDWCRANAIGEIMLAYVQSFEDVDPATYGFDAAVEFPPMRPLAPDITRSVPADAAGFDGTVRDWTYFVERSRRYAAVPYRLFRSVCPSWDNSARRCSGATVFALNSPALYREWLANAIAETERQSSSADERLVFVNAWNEWSEGAYLEPDQRFGHAWLAATREALEGVATPACSPSSLEPAIDATEVAAALRARLVEVEQALVARDAHVADQAVALGEAESAHARLGRVVEDGARRAVELERNAATLRQRAEHAELALAQGRAHTAALQRALDEGADALVRATTALEKRLDEALRVAREHQERHEELERLIRADASRIAELARAVSERDARIHALETIEQAHVRLEGRMASPVYLAGCLLRSIAGRRPLARAHAAASVNPPARVEHGAGQDARALRCSLVIPTCNGGALFGEVVEALLRQTCWSEVEFIVVDSGSSDSTTQIARAAGARVVAISPEQFNHGAARDYGIALAACERIILSVQDAVPDGVDTLERLLRALEEPGVAGAYARQVARPEADVLTRRNLAQWLTGRGARESRVMSNVAAYEALAPLEKFHFCNFDNVCSALNRSAWRHERFGAVNFGEDIDWAERVLRRGYRIVYEPAASVIHSHDRPLGYEYRRTYVCHRKLFRQFGVHLVPTLRGFFDAWLRSSRADLVYVVRHQRPLSRMLGVAALVPLRSFLSALAQYRAVRDEMRDRATEVRGV